jgi:hypothetical protein
MKPRETSQDTTPRGMKGVFRASQSPGTTRLFPRILLENVCYTTGMFILSNRQHDVISAAFGQARLRCAHRDGAQLRPALLKIINFNEGTRKGPSSG